MGQRTGYLANYPIACKIRRTTNQAISRVGLRGQEGKLRDQIRQRVRDRFRFREPSARRGVFGDVVDLPAPTVSGFGFALEALLSPVYRIREITTGVLTPDEIVIDRPY